MEPLLCEGQLHHRECPKALVSATLLLLNPPRCSPPEPPAPPTPSPTAPALAVTPDPEPQERENEDRHDGDPIRMTFIAAMVYSPVKVEW